MATLKELMAKQSPDSQQRIAAVSYTHLPDQIAGQHGHLCL